MEFTPALITAFASLSAAAIAGTIALVVSVLAKEQKTSEMRQQWIDALRVDVSDLIAELTILKITGEYVGSSEASVKQFLKDHHANFLKFATLLNRIRLRLNPKEHEHFVNLLWDLSEKISPLSTGKGSDEVADAAVEAVMVECIRVLGYEWKRVKKGEIAFRIAKCVAIAAVIAACTTIGVLAYRASIVLSMSQHAAIAQSAQITAMRNPAR